MSRGKIWRSSTAGRRVAMIGCPHWRQTSSAAMSMRLELLFEMVPQATVIALLVNPNIAITEGVIREVQAAAGATGVQLPILKAGTESEIDAAFAALAELHAGGLVIGPDAFFCS